MSTSFSDTAVTAFVCPEYVRIGSPCAKSQSLAVSSDDEVTKYAESAEKQQSHTHR